MNKAQQKVVLGLLYFLGLLVVLGASAWLYTIYNEELGAPYNPALSDYLDAFLGINSHDDHPKPFVIALGSLLLIGLDVFGIFWIRNSPSKE